jgi:hypothetical protein
MMKPRYPNTLLRLRHLYAMVATTGDEVEPLDYLLRIMFVHYNLGWWDVWDVRPYFYVICKRSLDLIL